MFLFAFIQKCDNKLHMVLSFMWKPFIHKRKGFDVSLNFYLMRPACSKEGLCKQGSNSNKIAIQLT